MQHNPPKTSIPITGVRQEVTDHGGSTIFVTPVYTGVPVEMPRPSGILMLDIPNFQAAQPALTRAHTATRDQVNATTGDSVVIDIDNKSNPQRTKENALIPRRPATAVAASSQHKFKPKKTSAARAAAAGAPSATNGNAVTAHVAAIEARTHHTAAAASPSSPPAAAPFDPSTTLIDSLQDSTNNDDTQMDQKSRATTNTSTSTRLQNGAATAAAGRPHRTQPSGEDKSLTNGQTVIRHYEDGMCSNLRLQTLALGTALTFAGNALAAGAGLTTAQLSPDTLSTLPLQRQARGALAFASSLWINYKANMHTFPIAWRELKRIFSHFGERKKTNGVILILAIIGGGTAGFIGYAGWSALLGWAAFAVGATSTTVFLGTRLYGLTTALLRFKNYFSPDQKAKVIQKLSHIKPEHLKDVEKEIANTLRNQQLTHEDLDTLQNYIEENTDHFNETGYTEGCLALLDATWGLIAAASALPGFTNSFLTAMEKIISFMKLTPGADSSFRPSPELESLIGVMFSIANPILYIGSAMNIRSALFGEQRRIALEKGWCTKGSAEYFFLFAANIFACSSLYNLTESTLRPNANGEFNAVARTLRDIDPTMTAESSSGQVLAYLAAAASFSVNASLSYTQAFPDKSPIGRLTKRVKDIDMDVKPNNTATAAAPASPASSSGSATPPQVDEKDVPMSRSVAPASHRRGGAPR